MDALPAPIPPPPPAVLELPSIRDAWLAGRKPTTLRAYAGDLDQFARWLAAPTGDAALGVLFALDAGRAHQLVLAYRAAMTEQGLATATIARRLAAVRSVADFARMTGRVAWSLEVPSPRVEPRRDSRGPDAASWRKLWKAAKARGDGPRARRDRAIVALLYDLALRRAEVVGLDLADLDLARGTIAVVGKGRTEREHLTLPEPTRRALLEWVDARGSHAGPLFGRLDRAAAACPGDDGRLSGDAIADLVASLGREAGVGRVRPHGLRHSAITGALDAGADVRSVRVFSRHRKIETVLRYDDSRKDLGGEVARKVAGSRK